MAKIKICGLFRERDIDFVNEAEPDYIGFVFAKSRRQVSASTALGLRDKLRNGIIPAGVFVNAPIEEISSLYRDGVIAIAQLHGGEDEAYIASLKALCPVPVIKAFRVDVSSRNEWKQTKADYLLFDNGTGGTGTAFDWSLIDLTQTPSFWFLAGGITVETITAAADLNPYGVDVSSGAETNGIKDRDKIIRLVQLVRLRDAGLEPTTFSSGG